MEAADRSTSSCSPHHQSYYWLAWLTHKVGGICDVYADKLIHPRGASEKRGTQGHVRANQRVGCTGPGCQAGMSVDGSLGRFQASQAVSRFIHPVRVRTGTAVFTGPLRWRVVSWT